MGFEPTRAEHNGLAVHRLNHSATSSCVDWLYSNSPIGDTFQSVYVGLERLENREMERIEEAS